MSDAKIIVEDDEGDVTEVKLVLDEGGYLGEEVGKIEIGGDFLAEGAAGCDLAAQQFDFVGGALVVEEDEGDEANGRCCPQHH